MYATWEGYTTIFLLGDEPSISQASFPRWERRARTDVDAATFGRLKDVDTLSQHREAVIMAVCELAEYHASDVVREGKGLLSVGVTGHSMAFDKESNPVREIIVRNLGETGLLFSGVG